MKRLLLLAAALLLTQPAVPAQPEPPRVEVALAAICRSFSDLTALQTPGVFAPEVLTGANLDELRQWVMTNAASHGPCTAGTLLSRSTVDPRRMTFAFTMRDGIRELAAVRENESGALAQLIGGGELPAAASMTVRRHWVTAADGVRLVTYVFTPPAGGARPVVLDRTPYLYVDGQFEYQLFYNTAKFFVDRGYAFVLQGVRGTPGSEGTFQLFDPVQVEDARATLDWIVEQPFASGAVAATGTSYEGFTALAAGVTNHPALRVVFAGGAPVSLGEDAFRVNGIVRTQLLDYLRYNHLHRGPKADLTFTTSLSTATLLEPDVQRYDDIMYGVDIPEWNEIAAVFNDPNAPLWRERSIKQLLPSIAVPTYHIAGTGADGDNEDVVSNFKTVDATSPYRERHRLILGPWDHAGSTPYDVGGAPLLAPFMARRIDSLLAHYLRGESSPYADEPRVQLVAADGTTAYGSDSLHVPGATEETLYFHGDNQLTATIPAAGESPTVFDYLPRQLPALDGPQNRKFTFTADHPRTILGELRGDLYVRSNRPVTDVQFALGKTDANGTLVPVAPSCSLGGRFYAANVPQRIEVRNCPVNISLAAGERLDVYVASNNFPLTFRIVETDANGRPAFVDAHVELLHSAEYPSSITWQAR